MSNKPCSRLKSRTFPGVDGPALQTKANRLNKSLRGCNAGSFCLSTVETTRMKKLLFITAVFCFVLSCKKEKQNAETFCFDGIVRYLGEPAADGLGWVLKNEGYESRQIYVPQNLSDNFKKDGLKVSVCLYKTDEKFSCFCTAPVDVYRIVSIIRR